jgi:hypothetical protein
MRYAPMSHERAPRVQDLAASGVRRTAKPGFARRKPRRPERLVALTVVFLEHREILEVALDARHEIFVTLPAHDAELALAARPPSAGASLDSQPGREPRPFRADEDEDGADE